MTFLARSELLDERTQLFPLSVDQYHTMIERGILPEGEPYELLNGQLVRKDRSSLGEDPMTVGPDHASAVDALANLNERLKKLGCYIRIQQPITLPPFDEPEPDGAIVRGTFARYRKRHPSAEDVLCLIEVADASLRRDRTTKLDIYARGGIKRYIILNLIDRVAEVYTNPDPDTGEYEQRSQLEPRQKLLLASVGGRSLTAAVSKLLS